MSYEATRTLSDRTSYRDHQAVPGPGHRVPENHLEFDVISPILSGKDS